MMRKLWRYLQRRRQHSYTELWELLYGDDGQGKGYIREADFAWETAVEWRIAFEECERARRGS